MKFLKLEKRNKISYVSFKRTKSLNALNSQTLKELIDLNKELESDSKTKVVVYRSEGKNFSAGADIKEKQKKLSKLELWKSNLGKEAIESILKINQITIASLRGYCLGGAACIATACDFRVACPESRFSANFAKLAFHQGFGTTITLPRVVGHQKAALMLLTGRRITGDEAFDIGLADYLVSKEELMSSAENLAHEINSAGPLGVQAIRSTIKEGLADEIEKITQWELSEQNRLRETEDFKEGIKASLDRRDPVFKSK